MKLTAEQLMKARSAKSAEELMELAKADGIEVTEEQAAEQFIMLHSEGELADIELDNVSGGECDSGSKGKTFERGDHVRITEGAYKGRTGVVDRPDYGNREHLAYMIFWDDNGEYTACRAGKLELIS